MQYMIFATGVITVLQVNMLERFYFEESFDFRRIK